METASDRPGEAKVADVLTRTHEAMDKAIAGAEAKARAALPAPASPVQAAAADLVGPDDLDLLLEVVFSVPGAFVTDAQRRALVDRLWQMDAARRRLMARALHVLILKYGWLWVEHAPLAIFGVGCGVHVGAALYGTAKLRQQWAAEDRAKAAKAPTEDRRDGQAA